MGKGDRFFQCQVLSSQAYSGGAEAGRIIGEVATLGLGAIARATAGNGRHWAVVFEGDKIWMAIHKTSSGGFWTASPNYDDMRSFADSGYQNFQVEKGFKAVKPVSWQNFTKIMDVAYKCKHHNTYSWDGSNCQHFAGELYHEL